MTKQLIRKISLLKKIRAANVLKFLNFEMKVPDDGSDEMKHVAHWCIILKCRVLLHTSFVFQYSSTQRDESE
jgi:hypothetical protein